MRLIPLPPNRRALVYLIACSKRKAETPMPARDLYAISPLFRKALALAEGEDPAGVHILSAEHGQIGPDDVIAPYNHALASDPKMRRDGWGLSVASDLAETYKGRRPHYVVIAGRDYRQPLVKHLPSYAVPLAGLGIGEQLRELNRLLALRPAPTT